MTDKQNNSTQAQKGAEEAKSPLFYIYSILGIAAFILAAIYVIYPCMRVDIFPSIFRSDRINGRVKVDYWEGWTGFEGEAVQKLVDKFNQSQDKIWVVKQTISNLNQRFLVSVAGNNPPDVAGIYFSSIPAYAEKGALMRLDNLVKEYGITEDYYLPIFWKMCTYRGHLYALPTTPSTLALHYNKKLFRESGLDPEKPPQTMQELDEMAEKLTKRDKNGRITVLGFSPSQPGWWHSSWGAWFGGDIWDGNEKLTLNSEAFINAFKWVQSYSKKYGVDSLQTFQSGFGSFSSAQNPFLSGLVAMELNGVWMYNFVEKFKPDLEYGVAPLPSAIPGVKNVGHVETNILSIPSNARHPKEAFEFIAFMQKKENLEQLCLEHRKLCPLRDVSDEFYKKHPNKYIKVFYDLAQSPNSVTYPQFSIWSEMMDEIWAVYTDVWIGRKEPKAALDELQAKLDKKWQRELAKIKKREAAEKERDGK